MKKRALVMMSVIVISVASIGSIAFAKAKDIETEIKQKERAAVDRTERFRNYSNHCGNREDMIEIMKEHGFKDMAKWMEEGDYEAMDDFMNNISDEDYDKMVDLMRESGYEGMSRMMESIGREKMINMHNSMMGANSSRFNMMGWQ